MAKVAVVTGSSSGIGYETSLLLARNQFTTYATMRNLGKSEELKGIASRERIPLHITQLNVNDDSSVENAIGSINKENGKIDLLVNNAGYDLFGSLEEASIEEIREQFETNFFGVVRTTKAVIPTMRKQGSGTIVNISSVGGRLGLTPFGTAYHASKFAIEGLTESLRHELADFNINIILVEPGAIRSNFVDNVKTVKGFDSNKSPYAKTVQQMFQGLETFFASSSHPVDVAQVILNAVNSPSPELRYPVGKDAESIFKARQNYRTEIWRNGYGKVIWKRRVSYVNDPVQMTDEKAAIVTGGSYAIGGEESTVALTKEVAKFVATARRVNECEETEHLAQIRF